MTGDLLLDTCTLIWLATGEPLSEVASRAIGEAAEAGQLAVSPITGWEIGMLMAKGRIVSTMAPGSWFRLALERGEIALAELPVAVLIASSYLPGEPPRDPTDRIIAATARDFGFTLVTRDRRLLDYADQGHLSAIAC